MNLDQFMLLKNKVQLKVLAMMSAELMFRGHGDSEPGVTSVTSRKSTWHADRS